MAPSGASEGWVLHEAHSDVGSWLRRSAAAHTLLLGAGFALLLLVLLAVGMRTGLPDPARRAAWTLLLAAALLAALPLPLLALDHARRNVTSVAVDPTGLTLMTRDGLRVVPFDALAEASVAAEPAFASVERRYRRDPLREVTSFHAVLRLREADGSTWEFVSRRADEVAGLVSWLGVLRVGDRVRAAPSGLAARRNATVALRRAEVLVEGACASLALALGFLAAARVGLIASSEAPSVAAGLVAFGCALYLGSYACQARAAQAWLEARGLAVGPPVEAPRQAVEAALPRAR